jgi:hypothetical protein
VTQQSSGPGCGSVRLTDGRLTDRRLTDGRAADHRLATIGPTAFTVAEWHINHKQLMV